MRKDIVIHDFGYFSGPISISELLEKCAQSNVELCDAYIEQYAEDTNDENFRIVLYQIDPNWKKEAIEQ